MPSTFSRERLAKVRQSVEGRFKFEDAVEIIPAEECERGMQALITEFQRQFRNKNRVVLMPVLRGGSEVGKRIADATGVIISKIRAAYYNEENKKNPEPQVLPDPPFQIQDIIIGVNNGELECRDIVLCEAVVETGETVAAIIRFVTEELRKYAIENNIVKIRFPVFHVYALIDKTDNSQRPSNLVAAFWVLKKIWVHGWGCDNNNQGREEDAIYGVQATDAKPEELQQPYYGALFSKKHHWMQRLPQVFGFR